MNLTLTRFEFRSDGIFGALSDETGHCLAHTLEHAYLIGIIDNWRPKIPAGTYTCVRGDHQLHGMADTFSTFEITGVPGHTGLLFHWGNYNRDSEGCVLLGKAEVDNNGEHMVTESRAAFASFLQLQSDVDSFTLTVVDSP